MFGSMQMAVSRVINLQHHRIAQVSIAFCSSCLPLLQLVTFLQVSVSTGLLCALSGPWKEHPPWLKMSMFVGKLAMELFAAVIVVGAGPATQIHSSPKTQQMVPAAGVPCHPGTPASSSNKATVAGEGLWKERE